MGAGGKDRRERGRWWDTAVEERRGELEGGRVIVVTVGMLVTRRRRLLPVFLAVEERRVRGRDVGARDVG